MADLHTLQRMTGTRVADTVRARLLARRRALGLTQAQAAAVVGWAQASLSKYEKGQLGADLDTLAALARRYGLTFADLLDGTEPDDPERAALLAAWAKLSPDARARLLAMLDVLTPHPGARTPQPDPQARRRKPVVTAEGDDARPPRRGRAEDA